MSRDAKVGLVIVFTFVFLLGTILVHRFHSTSPESPAGKIAGGSVSEGASSPGDGFEADDLSGPSNSGRTTTVEAVSSDPISPAGTTGRVSPPLQPVLPGAARLNSTPAMGESSAEAASTTDSGAHITLTDPQADRGRAAVVEHTPDHREIPEPNPVPERVTNFDMPSQRTNPPGRTVPLLEIPNRTRAADNAIEASSETVEMTPPATAGLGQLPDNPAIAPTQENPRMPNVPIQQNDPKPPEQNGTEEQPGEVPESVESSRPDEPARGNRDRRIQPKETTPPRLPRFSDPEEPTIESVPPRGSAGGPVERNNSPESVDQVTPRGGSSPSRSDDSERSQLAGQKTYVVKDGDSFWSISAKQYGSGKYFRALEEYNLERLPKYEDGQRILRPGSVIVLPELAMLRSRNSASKPAEKTPAVKSKTDPWREDRSQDRSAREDFRPSPRREVGSNATSAPATYRVQEGDTLSTIAQRELGSAKRWQEIYQLNRAKLPDQNSLKLGMELKLPPANPEKTADRSHPGR